MNEELKEISLLKKNWDGYHSKSIPKKLIKSAEILIEIIKELGFGEDYRIIPMSGGELEFVWHRKTKCLEMELEGKNTIYYLKWYPEEKMREEIFPFSDTKRIKELIEWFNNG